MKTLFLFLLISLFTIYSCKKDYSKIQTKVEMDGVVQKGPFLSGSSITIQELDNLFVPTTTVHSTQTTDNLGSFKINSTVSSQYIEIIARGSYFNEVSGSLTSSGITLKLLLKATDISSNVNILTTLEEERIKNLVKIKGNTFEDAVKQAENEILKIFGISETDIISFHSMDISKPGNSHGILLAISSILQGEQTVEQLADFIVKFQNDFKEDGKIDDTSLLNLIIQNSIKLQLKKTRQNLENRYKLLGVNLTSPSFEKYSKYYSHLSATTINIKYGDTISIYGKYFDTKPGATEVLITNNNKTYTLQPLSVSPDTLKVEIYNHEYPTQLLDISLFNIGIKTADTTIWCDQAVSFISSWLRLQDLPGNARYKSSTFSVGNSFYVCGGAGLGEVYKDLWKFNTVSESWTKMADLPGIARCYPRGFSNSSFGYVGAGFSADNSTKVQLYDYYKYNPQADSWSSIPAYPNNILNFYVGFTVSVSGRPFISLSNETMSILELVNDNWISHSTIHDMIDCPAAGVFSAGNKIYVILGYRENSTYSNTVWEYNSDSGVWTQKANFPGPARYAPAFFSIKNYGYYGCGSSTDSQQYKDMWRYDPANDKWIRIEDFPGGIRSHLLSTSVGNCGYIGLGWVRPLTMNQDYWKYNPD